MSIPITFTFYQVGKARWSVLMDGFIIANLKAKNEQAARARFAERLLRVLTVAEED